jgi:hypothetical protein
VLVGLAPCTMRGYITMSSLSRVIHERLGGTNYYIIGDSAYGLGVRLMKPYRNNGFLNQVF